MKNIITAAVAAMLLGAGCAGAAQAQTVNSGVGLGPSEQVSQPVTPAPPEHLFGDWGGVRTYLGNLGIDLTVDATTEFAGNVSGGTKQGATAANQIGIQADIDWGKLAGLEGFSTHSVFVNRSGANDSSLFGDNLLPVQEIFGAGGGVAVHFVYTYAEQQLFGGMVDILAGRMPVGNDFGSSPLYCNFMNNVICGNAKALSGANVAFSAWPDATWGGEIRVRPRPSLYAQFGVFEVNKGLYSNEFYKTGFEFNTSQDSGVVLPVELGYEPKVGRAGMPGHYKIGFAYDTSHFESFEAGLPTPPGQVAPASHAGVFQAWLLADQMLVRHGPGDTDGVIVLGEFIKDDPNALAYAEQYTVGVLDGDFWAARPKDIAGLLFSYNTVSGRLGNVQGVENEFGLPFSNGATGIQTNEMVLEANYDIHVTRGLNFAPDFQYIWRPNAQANIPNAAVLGFKAHVTF